MFTINFYFCVCEYQKKFLSPRAHYAREIRKHSFISMVRPTIHTNVMKREPFKLLFKLGAVWTENVSVILWLPCPSFPQTPIQILWCSVHGKTFHASFFFYLSQTSHVRGLNCLIGLHLLKCIDNHPT